MTPNHLCRSPGRVVAGLVPATPMRKARSRNDRGGRDKSGHDIHIGVSP